MYICTDTRTQGPWVWVLMDKGADEPKNTDGLPMTNTRGKPLAVE